MDGELEVTRTATVEFCVGFALSTDAEHVAFGEAGWRAFTAAVGLGLEAGFAAVGAGRIGDGDGLAATDGFGDGLGDGDGVGDAKADGETPGDGVSVATIPVFLLVESCEVSLRAPPASIMTKLIPMTARAAFRWGNRKA